VNLKILRRTPVSAFLELKKVEKTKCKVIPICLWGLRMQVMKMTPISYAPYTTQFCYVPNFVDTVVLITLNIRTKLLVFSSVRLRHYNKLSQPYGKRFKD